MDLGLKNKVALVTGAGQGIGREIAKVLANEGAKVVVNDFYAERAQKVADEIKGDEGIAIGIQCDVSFLDQVKTMADESKEKAGSIDILVNNAGVPLSIREGKDKRTIFPEIDPSSWKKDIDLSLYGALNCTYAVLPTMIEKRNGKIVNIISDAGRTGEAYLSVYAGAKAGVLGFSKSLAKEVGRHCINVNCIAIGATAHEGLKPPLSLDSTPENNETLKKMLKLYPIGRGLKRVGLPSDVAYAVAFLASPRACFITGQCLPVNGGFSMVG
jgi:2-hydroxycyclohexanecarboxyl-CoA dehydrogenase